MSKFILPPWFTQKLESLLTEIELKGAEKEKMKIRRKWRMLMNKRDATTQKLIDLTDEFDDYIEKGTLKASNKKKK